MCCKSTLHLQFPHDPDVVRPLIQRIMELSQFEERNPDTWVRTLPPLEDASGYGAGRYVTLTYLPVGKYISMSLSPSIGSHDLHQHTVNSLGASIMFKVLMTLGEQVGGLVTQDSLVGGCRDESNGTGQLTLASYPEQPLMFEKLCWGFRQTLGKGVAQEPPHDEETVC